LVYRSAIGHPSLRSLSKVKKRTAVERLAVKDDGGDAAHIPDILGGIGIEDEDIGAAAGRDESKLIPAELESS
jgi:hypothetical protein